MIGKRNTESKVTCVLCRLFSKLIHERYLTDVVYVEPRGIFTINSHVVLFGIAGRCQHAKIVAVYTYCNDTNSLFYLYSVYAVLTTLKEFKRSVSWGDGERLGRNLSTKI